MFKAEFVTLISLKVPSGSNVKKYWLLWRSVGIFALSQAPEKNGEMPNSHGLSIHFGVKHSLRSGGGSGGKTNLHTEDALEKL